MGNLKVKESLKNCQAYIKNIFNLTYFQNSELLVNVVTCKSSNFPSAL